MTKWLMAGLTAIIALVISNTIIVILFGDVGGFGYVINGLVAYYFGRKIFQYYQRLDNK